MNEVGATNTVFCFFINGTQPITIVQLKNAFAELKNNQPAFLFIDRIDALPPPPYRPEDKGTTERSVHTELTNLLDPLNLPSQIRVVATTNKPDFLDPRLRDIFDREIKMPIPDANSRVQILQKSLEKMSLATDVYLPTIAGKTDGYVGADLAELCSEAAVEQFQRQIGMAASQGRSETPGLDQRKVTIEDFEAALAAFRPGASS